MPPSPATTGNFHHFFGNGPRTIFQPERHLLREFVASHAPKFSGDVLDIGGGKGRYRTLFKNARSYRILDVDPANTPDIVASADHIPLPDSSVDGIVCTQVLGDVWDVPLVIAEMLRVLKKGGLLLITESLHCEFHDEPRDYWRFTAETWKKLFEGTCEFLVLEERGGYFSLRVQQYVRRMILRHRPYERPILGRIFNIYATLIGRRALRKDARSHREINGRFALGHSLLLQKR
jgi:SAM-dependent methyltransferase